MLWCWGSSERGFAFFAALIQGFVLVFHWVDISHKHIWRGHRSPWLSQRRGIVILEVSPSREVRKYSATTSCRSVSAGSGQAPGIAPTDPQIPAGISEGSTKLLLQVQLDFLWNICQLSASHMWHLQYNASFKQKCAGRPWNILFLPNIHGLYALGSEQNPASLSSLWLTKYFSVTFLASCTISSYKRLLFGNKILVKELLEGQSPMSGCVCIHVYPWVMDTCRDTYVEISNESHNPAVSKECSFTESGEEALISQTVTLWFSQISQSRCQYSLNLKPVELIHGIRATETYRNSCLRIFFKLSMPQNSWWFFKINYYFLCFLLFFFFSFIFNMENPCQTSLAQPQRCRCRIWTSGQQQQSLGRARCVRERDF